MRRYPDGSFEYGPRDPVQVETENGREHGTILALPNYKDGQPFYRVQLPGRVVHVSGVALIKQADTGELGFVRELRPEELHTHRPPELPPAPVVEARPAPPWIASTLPPATELQELYQVAAADHNAALAAGDSEMEDACRTLRSALRRLIRLKQFREEQG